MLQGGDMICAPRTELQIDMLYAPELKSSEMQAVAQAVLE